MEEQIKRCKETNKQLSETQKLMHEMVKELVKRCQLELEEEYIEFDIDERPLYADPETGYLECYYRAKVVDDKLLMTKDDGEEEYYEYNDDWSHRDVIDLHQVYDCIIKTVEAYLAEMEEQAYWAWVDYDDAENG